MRAILTLKGKEELEKVRVLADNSGTANYPYHGHRELKDWELYKLVLIGTPNNLSHFLHYELKKQKAEAFVCKQEILPGY